MQVKIAVLNLYFLPPLFHTTRAKALTTEALPLADTDTKIKVSPGPLPHRHYFSNCTGNNNAAIIK